MTEYRIKLYDGRLGKNDTEKWMRELAIILKKKNHRYFVIEKVTTEKIATKLH